jgi:dolichol-phosphate mannosyltransferase
MTAIQESVETKHRIHIVCDFDDDNTLPVAREFITKGVDLEFVNNPTRGAVNAIKTGLRKAGEDYLLVTMADMSEYGFELYK